MTNKFESTNYRTLIRSKRFKILRPEIQQRNSAVSRRRTICVNNGLKSRRMHKISNRSTHIKAKIGKDSRVEDLMQVQRLSLEMKEINRPQVFNFLAQLKIPIRQVGFKTTKTKKFKANSLSPIIESKYSPKKPHHRK